MQGRIQDFPFGDVPTPLKGGQPPMPAIFGENVCENGRIGYRWGGQGDVCQHHLTPLIRHWYAD